MKESQRRMIWRADRLFTAAEALNINDEFYANMSWDLNQRAHQLVRDAGFKDAPTFELVAFCRQVCEDYRAGRLLITPFE